MQIEQIPIARIEVPPVRITSYMPEEIAEQFRSSIQAVGVLEPALVIREGEHLWLVNGLHRLEQAKQRADLTLPCVIVDGTLDEVLLWNLVTSGLHGRPKHSEVRAVLRVLYEERGLDVIAIRKRTGLSQRYIEDLLLVNQALPRVQQALDDDEIKLGHAVALAGVRDAAMQERVFVMVMQHRPTVAMLAQLVRDLPTDAEVMTEERFLERHGAELPPPGQAQCQNCEQVVRQRDIRPVFMCPACYAALWSAVHVVSQNRET